MLSKGLKMLLCAAVMVAAVKAAPFAGEVPPVSLTSRSLSVASAAKEEFVRQAGDQYFEMRILESGWRYEVYIEPMPGPGQYIGIRCDHSIRENSCGNGCGQCFRVTFGADLKVISSFWDRSNGVIGEIGSGYVLPF